MGDDASQLIDSIMSFGKVGARVGQKVVCRGHSNPDDRAMWRGNAERRFCDLLDTKAACDKLKLGCVWDNADGTCLPTPHPTREDFQALASKREAYFTKYICRELPPGDCPTPECTVSDGGRCKYADI